MPPLGYSTPGAVRRHRARQQLRASTRFRDGSATEAPPFQEGPPVHVGGFFLGFLNELGRIELSNMPKESPVTGPMRTQPVERASNVPTPVLPMMPMGGKLKKAPQPRQKTTTRTEAVRVAKAKITRRNSLRKQRQALKG
jgi:hypothetical protein